MRFLDIGGMFFCTFSSKKATSSHSTNSCNKNISGNFLYFTFTGKEKDEETGYGYFGARYIDHELMTMWLSVDPMADKYPSISPYAYCAWNPVRLVDPDGKETMENDDWYKDGKGRLKWDPSVTRETKLKEGEEYLGETMLLTNNEGQTVYGDEQGRLHASVPLAEVSITDKAARVVFSGRHNNIRVCALMAKTFCL